MKQTNNPGVTAQSTAPSDDYAGSEAEPIEAAQDGWDETGEDEIRRVLRYGLVGGSRDLR